MPCSYNVQIGNSVLFTVVLTSWFGIVSERAAFDGCTLHMGVASRGGVFGVWTGASNDMPNQ
jgi:hypothetical protein